jgi:hypothetical protein
MPMIAPTKTQAKTVSEVVIVLTGQTKRLMLEKVEMGSRADTQF